MNVTVPNEHSFKHYLATGMTLFLGAGFSVLARDKQGKNLPLGTELAHELIEVFELNLSSNAPLAIVCSVLARTRSEELNKFLSTRFNVDSYDPRYATLTHLDLKSVFTTNVDNLVERVYSDTTYQYLNDVHHYGPAGLPEAVDIAHLCGCVTHGDRPYTMSSEELASALSNDPSSYYHLATTLSMSPTLFWGFSMSDTAVLFAHSLSANKTGPRHKHWILVHPSTSEDTLTYYRALDLQVILASTDEFLDYLAAVIRDNSLSPNGIAVGDRDAVLAKYSRFAIPNPASTPRRPLETFFCGSEPQWSDVYSNDLHYTAQFYDAQNALHANRSCIILGPPASGKTTMLMQLATTYQTQKQKLYFPSISLPQAENLIEVSRDAELMLFIDNLADDSDAVAFLQSRHNVQLVLAERAYNFEFVTHRIDRNNVAFIDVSELTEEDWAACLRSIPRHLIKPDAAAVKYQSDSQSSARPSLFELIQASLQYPTLRKRFRDVVDELGDDSEELLDLFVLICYCSRCRIPTSMDLVHAYFKHHDLDYKDVYSLIQRLPSLVSDSLGISLSDSHDESEQDYWVPRSTFVGEAGIASTSEADLSRVLMTFHQNISYYLIPRYDVFKRHGFDNTLAVQAFPNIADGQRYYDLIASKEPSAHVLQHYALYLSKKRNHDDAFSLIDRASRLPDGGAFSIRNSAAIIQFRANISKPKSAITDRNIVSSMDLLEDCYDSDRRKLFHAIVYADQVLQIAEAYGDESARRFSAKALQWLREEASQAPWNRRARELLRRLESLG